MKSSACKKIKSKFYYLSHCEIIKNKTDKKMTRAGWKKLRKLRKSTVLHSMEEIFLLLSLYLEAKFSQQQDFHILYSALPGACRTHFLPFRTEKKTMLPRFPSAFPDRPKRQVTKPENLGKPHIISHQEVLYI